MSMCCPLDTIAQMRQFALRVQPGVPAPGAWPTPLSCACNDQTAILVVTPYRIVSMCCPLDTIAQMRQFALRVHPGIPPQESGP